MLELEVETYLRHEVEKLGGLCEKLEHVRGAPDRLVTWPYLGMELVETKRPPSKTRHDAGGKLMRHQQRDHQKRALRGTKVFTLYTKDQVDDYVGFCAAQISEIKKQTWDTFNDIHRFAARIMEHAQRCDAYGNDRTAKKKSKESQMSMPL